MSNERHVQVRQAAYDDLLDIFIYGCEKFGIDTADAYVRRLEAGFQQLTVHLKLGYSIEQAIEGIRALPVVSHVIYYHLTGNAVDIIRILHKSMLPERYLTNADT